MTQQRRQKKSESIEIRVPLDLKTALKRRAAMEGRSVSAVLRRLIEDYVHRPNSAPQGLMSTVRQRPRPAFAAVLGAAGLSALLASALPVGAAPELRAAFERTDGDGDGVVTEQEYVEAFSGPPPVIVGGPRAGEAPSPPPPDWPPPPLDGPHSYIRLPVIIPGSSSKSWVMIPVPGLDAADPSPVPITQRAEISPDAAVARNFAGMDANADRTLTFDEFAAPQEAVFNRSFTYMDANGDGAVDSGEVEALNALARNIGDLLEDIDADGDGRVTRAEYDAAS